MVLEKRKCTFETIVKDANNKKKKIVCNKDLLILLDIEGEFGAFLCEEHDAIQFLPKSMRKRIVEQ